MPSKREVLAWMARAGSRKNVEGMRRYALPGHFGISVAVLQKYARDIGTDHALAVQLWKTGWLEPQITASFLADPAKVTPALMDDWCKDFDNWGSTDTVCFKLFDRSPHAWKMVPRWVKRKGEYQKRAGFVLMACLAQHDKAAPDAPFLKFLSMIEQGADDERNFVKKGVSWALRGIGHRNLKLHAAAIKTATALAQSDDAASRWVGKDALRDLTRPAVARKVAKKQ
jgi:3-methyladenine DNA glycosylase AlkD